MGNITKQRRQETIFQILRGRDEESALSANEIHQALKREELDVNLRTVRRDIEDLSQTHGLVSTETTPERFYPLKDYEMKYNLHLNENTLQVLLIALNNLKNNSHEYFKNFAAEAETAFLNSLDPHVSQCLQEAKKRYRFDYSASGKPESENTQDFEKMMQALRENKIFNCDYHSPYKSSEDQESKRRHFAPYVFILSSNIPYLIVHDQDDDQYKKLRMTRAENVDLSKEKFTPENIDNQIDLKSAFGGWGGIDQKPIEVKIICDEIMATFFKEKVIHQSQKVESLSEDRYQISLCCAKSYEMTRLIASFGGHIESISPNKLYDEVKGIWNSGLTNIA